MRLVISCIGRMKAGPERELFWRYFGRAAKTAQACGFKRLDLDETSESREAGAAARKKAESARLMEACEDPQTAVIVFDENGSAMTSRQFADCLSVMRDRGTRTCHLAIGGPDGHDPELIARADHVVAFGRLTMPHQLVRVLVAEQIYRAMAIVSGHPYHRD